MGGKNQILVGLGGLGHTIGLAMSQAWGGSIGYSVLWHIDWGLHMYCVSSICGISGFFITVMNGTAGGAAGGGATGHGSERAVKRLTSSSFGACHSERGELQCSLA